MIDISFVQDNLPTPEEQLELFKQLLDNLYELKKSIPENPITKFEHYLTHLCC